MAIKTYGNMQARIADELINSAVTPSHIQNAILSAIAYYEDAPLWFNQSSGSFNTVAGQEYYGAADLADIPDMRMVRALNIALNGVKRMVQAVDFAEIDSQQTGAYVGLPFSFAIYNNEIRMFPIPDNAYPVQVFFNAGLADLSADNDTNAWMNEGEILIRQRAKFILAVDVLYDDGLSTRAKAMEEEEFARLRMATNRRMPARVLNYPNMGQSRTFNVFTGF